MMREIKVFYLHMISATSSHTPERENNDVSSSLLANQTAYNVSKLLDSLLQDYDNSLRPDFAGKRRSNIAMTSDCSSERTFIADRSEHASAKHGAHF